MANFSKILRAGMIASVATVAMGATSALAQESAANSAAAADPLSGEIVVFARKRIESIQSVPISISAISGDMAERRGISSALDLTAITPNLTTNSAFGETQPNYSLRGISVANEFNPNQASPIGVYVDEAYMSNRISHGLQLLDIDRVEVLRGPQGTLYGRNTTGGAISVYTRKPSLAGGISGYAEAGYGNKNRIEGKAAIDATLDEAGTWGLRIAGMGIKSDGLIENLHPGKDDLNSTNTLAGRLTLRFRPNSDFDATLAVYAGRNRPTSSAVFGDGILPGGVNPLSGYSRAGLDFWSADMNESGLYRTWGKGALLRLEGNVADGVKLTSVTSLDDGGQDLDFDVDGSPANILTDKWKAKFKQFNQEVRLGFAPVDSLDLTVGGYYGSDTVEIDYKNYFLTSIPAFAFETSVTSKQQRHSYAFFGNAEWAIVENLNLSAGVRWTHDDIQVLDDTAFYAGVQTIGPNYDTPKQNSSAVTARVSLDYNVAQDVKVFASFARGYRGGGYNAVTSNGLNALTYVSPETVDAYELGLKSQFADRKVTLNASLFYNDYKNQQLQELIGPVSYLRNAGQSTLKGAELELTIKPVRTFTISGTLGYLDAKYDKLTLSAKVLDGNRLPFAPRWAGNVNVDWTFVDTDTVRVSTNLTGSYAGFQYFSPFNNVGDPTKIYSQDGYWMVNGQVRADFGKAYVAVWARNLLEKKVFVYGIDTRSLGFNYLVQNNPRTFGVRVGTSF